MSLYMIHSLWQGSANRTHKSNLAYCLFLCHLWAKDGVYIFRWLKKTKRRRENDMKFKFQWPEVKFSWHRAKFIRLQTVCGSFCAAVAGLSSCNRDRMAHKAIYLLSSPLQKTKSACVITSERWYGIFISIYLTIISLNYFHLHLVACEWFISVLEPLEFVHDSIIMLPCN